MESPSFLSVLSILVLCQLFAAFSVSSSSMQYSRCHDYERSALLQFKESFRYCNDSKVESWKLMHGDCCSWDGVECDQKTNHVISLDLSESCLHGFINSNSTLFTLVHLQILDLSYNNFSFSQIPPEIGLLSSLTRLNLSHSFFYGQIPRQISCLSELVYLDLSNYYILHSGESLSKLPEPSFRELIQNLTNLKSLNLRNVNISSRVPDILSNLSSLETLTLRKCGFYGVFPIAVFQLPNLKVIDLSLNFNLTGNLPVFLPGNPLVSLDLTETQFDGDLPASMGNLAHLEVLDVGGCNFIGKLPLTFLSNLTELVDLDISYMLFNHPNPSLSSFSGLGNLPKLSRIALHYNNLAGEIPSWLMNLTELTILSLGYNKLTGPIPTSLTNLSLLEGVHLQVNQLSGQIRTSLTSLSRLKGLYLFENRLSGQIPFQINNLTSLRGLGLSDNKLSGSIPNNISNLQDLEIFHVDSNNLIGSVDISMFAPLKNLFSLYLSSNNLSLVINSSSNVSFLNLKVLGLGSCNISEFPMFLQNLHELEFLDLSSNKLSGQIPSLMSKLSTNSLQYLNLSHNQLTGFEPESTFPSWAPLTYLDIRDNRLQGSLPIPPLSTTYYLVSHNNFSGFVSPLICNLTSLVALDLSFNNLSGELPSCLGSFSDSLYLLDLTSNNFHGSIPSIWRDGCNLRMISMSRNRLQGQLPKSLVNCSLLEFIDFGNNQLIDGFPSWFGKFQELRIMILRSNGLYGVIEKFESAGFPNLDIIDLSNNSFIGKLPSKLIDTWNKMKVVNKSNIEYMEKSMFPGSYLGTTYYGLYDYSMIIYNKGLEMNYTKIPNILMGIDFSNNKFQGPIPDVIGNLTGLQFLNLSRNNLDGLIPASLANLQELECLDLSNNHLSGRIPTQLADVTSLSSFDVSFNNLAGPIPHGTQFCTFEAKSYKENQDSLMESWTNQCKNIKSNPPPHPSYTGGEEESSESAFEMNGLIVSLGYASGLIVGVVAGNEFFRRKYYWFSKIMERKQKRRTRNRN